jgi:hypothetical protein
MYVVSLNVDLSFSKAFSDTPIAKQFLEDVLGVVITEIELLSKAHKITDGAVVVKFDFRCKINGGYVIIEMQQKYKPDVNKRFYLYHCISTALQLETLEPVVVTGRDGKKYKDKNYSGLEPVITFIWMVDDRLNFTDDFVVFSTLPEAAKDFITDPHLWSQPFDVILSESEKVLKTLHNTTKELDFFSKNRLIYAFQQNIIINNNYNALYFPWFDFAQTSRKQDNTENDFLKFKNKAVMAELINRLKIDKFTSEELMYLSSNYELEMQVFQNQEDKRKSEEKEVKLQAELKAEREQRQAEREQRQAELKAEREQRQAELKAEREQRQAELKAEREQRHADLLKGIKKLQKRSETIEAIADFFELPIEEITALVKEIEEKERENTTNKSGY